MERKIFIKTTTLALVVYPFLKISAMLNLHINPEKYFFEKDGIIPNRGQSTKSKILYVKDKIY